MSRLVVTVDGLAATGKSSLAAALAKKLGWVSLNSGRFYRGVARAVLDAKVDPDNETAVLRVLASASLTFSVSPETMVRVAIDGRDVTDGLEASIVSDYTSRVSRYPKVRDLINAKLHGAFEGLNLVAEGRDMGTVVFPESPVKFFVTAEPRVRAERRFKQLCEKNLQGSETVESIENDIKVRDKRDSERPIAPTVPAEGAIIVDNSSSTLTEVVEKMYSAVAKFAAHQG